MTEEEQPNVEAEDPPPDTFALFAQGLGVDKAVLLGHSKDGKLTRYFYNLTSLEAVGYLELAKTVTISADILKQK